MAFASLRGPRCPSRRAGGVTAAPPGRSHAWLEECQDGRRHRRQGAPEFRTAARRPRKRLTDGLARAADTRSDLASRLPVGRRAYAVVRHMRIHRTMDRWRLRTDLTAGETAVAEMPAVRKGAVRGWPWRRLFANAMQQVPPDLDLARRQLAAAERDAHELHQPAWNAGSARCLAISAAYRNRLRATRVKPPARLLEGQPGAEPVTAKRSTGRYVSRVSGDVSTSPGIADPWLPCAARQSRTGMHRFAAAARAGRSTRPAGSNARNVKNRP